MPRIGMRIFKTFAAVFLCLCLNLLLWEDGIPFYSAIAAILCMQADVSNSVKVAVNRTVGTFIGGLFGMLVLVLLRDVLPQDLYGYRLWEYLIVSLCVIPLIRSTVLVQRPAAAYITCVVFLSITISHGTDSNPYMFAINRILDTLLGVFVSLGVNSLQLPRRHNRNVLMIASMEDAMLHEGEPLSGYTRFKLNEMLQRGALITVVSRDTPAVLASRQDGVDWRLPIIAMRGAVLFDVKKGRYLSSSELEDDTAHRVLDILAGHGVDSFVFCVIHHNLHVYYQNVDNPAMLAHYEEMNRIPGQHYICGSPPPGARVLAIRAYIGTDAVEAIMTDWRELEAAGQIRVIQTRVIGTVDQSAVLTAAGETNGHAAVAQAVPGSSSNAYSIQAVSGMDSEGAAVSSDGFAGCLETVCIEIYSGAAMAERRIRELQGMHTAEAVAFFGSRLEDLPWAECADAVYATGQAEQGFLEKADEVLENKGGDTVALAMGKLFHARKPIGAKDKRNTRENNKAKKLS